MAVHPRKLPVLPKPQFFFGFSKLLGSLPPAPPLQPGLPAASAAAASLRLLIVAGFTCCHAEIFSFSKLSFPAPKFQPSAFQSFSWLPLPDCSPAFPRHLLLPVSCSCSSSSRAAQAAICLAFRSGCLSSQASRRPSFNFGFSKLSWLPLPHCSPAFPQHLLLPLPYGCSSSQDSRPKPQFHSLSSSKLPPTPTAARPSRSICCCRFPVAARPRKLPVTAENSNLSVQWPHPDPLAASMPLSLVNHFCSKSNLWERARLFEPVELLHPSRPFEPPAFPFFTGLCCSLHRLYRPSALPGLPKGLEPPLEPSAEGSDDVFGSPLRCSGGRVREAADVSCRSIPSFLPSFLGSTNMAFALFNHMFWKRNLTQKAAALRLCSLGLRVTG